MKSSETFNSNNQAVAFGVKKKPKDPTPAWFKEFEQRINVKFNKIEKRISNIEVKLDKHEQLFKNHGWIN